MDVKTRILVCRLLEEMHRQDEYSRELRLTDESAFRKHESQHVNNDTEKENMSWK